MLRRVLLALVSLAVSLTMLEGVMRVTGIAVHDFAHDLEKYGTLLVWDEDGQYFRHIPGLSAVLGGVTLRFNVIGMRGPNPAVPKPLGTVRILCVGDSVTFGPGVPEELVYPARLQALLAPAAVDVVVGAVQGWNTEQEEHFLASNIDRLHPDVVVLLYVVNDIEPTEQMRMAYAPRTRWTERAYRQLVLRSRLFEWGAFSYRKWALRGGLAGLERMAYWRKQREEEGTEFARTDPGWLRSRAALVRMADLVRGRGGRFVIFLHHLGNPPNAPDALVRLQEFGRDAGVPVFDTAPYFAGYDPMTLVNRPFVDPHPNVQGHALLAAGMARALRDGAFVPAGRRSSGLAPISSG